MKKHCHINCSDIFLQSHNSKVDFIVFTYLGKPSTRNCKILTSLWKHYQWCNYNPFILQYRKYTLRLCVDICQVYNLVNTTRNSLFQNILPRKLEVKIYTKNRSYQIKKDMKRFKGILWWQKKMGETNPFKLKCKCIFWTWITFFFVLQICFKNLYI